MTGYFITGYFSRLQAQALSYGLALNLMHCQNDADVLVLTMGKKEVPDACLSPLPI
ncbi:hypothetical protein [Egbenema bharatensis]|uniref:hypothetical protein n=1 Tax=Egbenema bharatensis TaxID=3463334 RepID=UPI003A838063